jgi:hypothetical protein
MRSPAINTDESHCHRRGRFNFALDEHLVAALLDPDVKRKLSSVRADFLKFILQIYFALRRPACKQ